MARGRWQALRVLGLAGTAILVTWPVVLRMGSRLPLGTETVTTVPRFNLWTMEWNARGLGPFRSGYWDAPIFSPTHGTFAFSDAQPLTGQLFHALVFVGFSATVAYGLVLLGALTLNGFAAARLLDRLGAEFVPATLTGVLVVALPFVADELGVLQLSMVWPVLFALGALAAYVQQPSWQRAAMVGVWCTASLFTSSYYALMLVIVLAIVALVLVVSMEARVALLGHLAAAAAVPVLVGLPYVLAESSHLEGYRWMRQTVAGLGAKGGDWVILDDRAWGTVVAPWLAPHGAWRFTLYPGTVMLALAIGGAIASRRTNPRWVVALLCVVVVTVILAGGLGLELFGWSPYSVLRDHVPGFERIRSPFRFAVMTHLAIAILAGLGLDALWGRSEAEALTGAERGTTLRATSREHVRSDKGLWGRSEAEALTGAERGPTIRAASREHVRSDKGLWRRERRVGPVFAVILTMFAVLEVVQLPAHTGAAITGDNADWVDYLEAQPEHPVAMVPFPESGSVVDYDDTTEVMLLGLDFEKPLVNGYSGFFPESYSELRVTMQTFPDEASLAALQNFDVRWIVVPNEWLTTGREVGMDLVGFADEPVFRGTERSIFEVPARS